MKKDLSEGAITKTILLFAGPMILGNLLQQCYNIADTLIVGRFLGAHALAAVGSAYTLMTFLNSIIIGLCMGSGAVFSVYFGKKEEEGLRGSIGTSFGMIALVTLAINGLVFLFLDPILRVLQVPADVYDLMREYVFVIFFGIVFIFLYNYFAFLLRALGNSVVPLGFLCISAGLNIVLDLLCVIVFQMNVSGAAFATVVSQIVSGVGIALYTLKKVPEAHSIFKVSRDGSLFREVLHNSFAACIQQSVMNFGILMIQGLVNSFGMAVMAAFAAAVKIDTFAYMPAQEFGNAFSLFVSQNHGAGRKDRVLEGMKKAAGLSAGFCIVISGLIFAFAPLLMRIFVDSTETQIVQIGAQYLRIEGAFYCGIGILFLFYGFFRGVEKSVMSLVLTVISLGTRVVLAYVLSPVPQIGVLGIWWAIPIGWILADSVGLWRLLKWKRE